MRLIDADKLIFQSHAQHLLPYIDKKDIDNAPTVEVAKDCISREEVRKLICQNNDAYGYSDRFHEFTEKCLQLPSVTTQPKRGKWIDTGSGQECDQCHEIQYGYDSGRYYCPNCGARMHGGGEE